MNIHEKINIRSHHGYFNSTFRAKMVYQELREECNVIELERPFYSELDLIPLYGYNKEEIFKLKF